MNEVGYGKFVLVRILMFLWLLVYGTGIYNLDEDGESMICQDINRHRPKIVLPICRFEIKFSFKNKCRFMI